MRKLLQIGAVLLALGMPPIHGADATELLFYYTVDLYTFSSNPFEIITFDSLRTQSRPPTS